MSSTYSPETSSSNGRSDRQTRWEEEARFFDQLAENVDESKLPVDPLALQRYSRSVLRNRFNKEFRFSLLRPLSGKVLLDVGCGDGLNSVMFAKMGARVTGLDISPGAIGVARRRAEVNGVAESTTFICAPIETAELEPDSFDVIWADAILHHVLDDLNVVLRHLASWAKPQGLLLFSEPVNRANPLRRLRSMIPIQAEATPGERPLVKSELDLVKHYVPDLQMRPYGLFGRLDPFILTNCNYERSSTARRAIVSAIDMVDYALLSVPLFQRLAGVCVMYGHPNKDLVTDRSSN